MVTKRELAAEAATLGEELGVAVDTAGMNHAALTALVEDLRKQKATRSTEPSAAGLDDELEVDLEGDDDDDDDDDFDDEKDRGATGDELEDIGSDGELGDAPPTTSGARPIDGAATDKIGGAVAVRPVFSFPMQVADGRQIHTSPRGKLGAGARVKTTDFPPETLEQLIADGTVVCRK